MAKKVHRSLGGVTDALLDTFDEVNEAPDVGLAAKVDMQTKLLRGIATAVGLDLSYKRLYLRSPELAAATAKIPLGRGKK